MTPTALRPGPAIRSTCPLLLWLVLCAPTVAQDDPPSLAGAKELWNELVATKEPHAGLPAVRRALAAEEHRRGTEAGLEALCWATGISSIWIHRPAWSDAWCECLGRFADHYAQNPAAADLLFRQARRLPDEARERALAALARIEGRTESSRLRAAALLGRAQILLEKDRSEPLDEAERKLAIAACDILSSEHADMTTSLNAPARVRKQRRHATIADLVPGIRFELAHLHVGATAPDIVAPDLDGETFRLSDHRGEVVLLDFWAHW